MIPIPLERGDSKLSRALRFSPNKAIHAEIHPILSEKCIAMLLSLTGEIMKCDLLMGLRAWRMGKNAYIINHMIIQMICQHVNNDKHWTCTINPPSFTTTHEIISLAHMVIFSRNSYQILVATTVPSV
jgi:hypothetical protein